MRTPRTETFRKLLRKLYSAEDADLVVRMPFGLSTLERIARVTGIDRKELEPRLARLVKARTPVRQSFLRKLRNRKLRNVVESMDEVESLIADIETGMKGMPILLKQYLKLGGKLLQLFWVQVFQGSTYGQVEPLAVGR